MKSFISALLASFLVPAALACDITVAFDPETAEEWTETYGEREVDYLSERVSDDLHDALAAAGLSVAQVNVTIIDARPNRPTFKQASDRPGLDQFRSFSVGGMSLRAEAFDTDGTQLGDYAYKWFSHDIRFASHRPTWSDANRASDIFSRRFIAELTDQ